MIFKLALAATKAPGLMMGAALTGDANEAHVDQIGTGNPASIVQAGNSNYASFSQAGNFSSIGVSQ